MTDNVYLGCVPYRVRPIDAAKLGDGSDVIEEAAARNDSTAVYNTKIAL